MTISKKLFSARVIFLDRDGVINKKPKRGEYVKIWEEFEFLPGAVEAISSFNQKGYSVFIITNQAGIGRGFMSENDLKIIHQNMEKELEKNEAKISGIYYCPHEINEDCECRKPKSGLLLRAAEEHNLDLKEVIFVGDDEKDLLAGQAAGCKTLLVAPEKSLLDIANSIFKMND